LAEFIAVRKEPAPPLALDVTVKTSALAEIEHSNARIKKTVYPFEVIMN
jgi:hypothetical protein